MFVGLRRQGGLGIRCLNAFNNALLSKWRWRFLVDKATLWSLILEHRYGCLVGVALGRVPSATVKKNLLWWRDIVDCNINGEFEDWFLGGVACRLGCGDSIRFWHNNWCRGIPFKVLFPKTYSFSNVKEANGLFCSVNMGMEVGFKSGKFNFSSCWSNAWTGGDLARLRSHWRRRRQFYMVQG